MRSIPVVLLVLASCPGGDTDGSDDTDSGITGELLGIGLSPREPVLGVGESVRFQVRAFYDDTNTLDITNDVSWVSTEPRVATVSASGEAVGLAPGQTEVIATDARGVATKTVVSVRGGADTPTEVQLAPRTVELKVGAEVDMVATGTFADGTSGNLAASCAWSIDEAPVASVVAGRLVGLSEGRTTVRATCGGVAAAAPVSVRAADAELDLPDLVVDDFIVDVVDGELQVLVEVKNAGLGMSPLAFVGLYVDPEEAPDASVEPDEIDLIEALAPNESGIALIAVPELTAGPHEFWLWVDLDEQIREGDEANLSGPHAFSVTSARADLVVDSFEGSTDGTYTFWTVRVRNAGTATARNFWIDLWQDPEDEPGVCDTGDHFEWVGELAPGATYVWEPDVDDGPEVSWLSVAYVDSCDDVAESNESDNIEYAWVEE